MSRTRLLLHLVDVAPFGEAPDPVEDVRVIERELVKFSPELATRERWLVMNKVDLVPAEERETRCRDIVQGLAWQGPVFKITAINGEGTQELVYKIMDYLESREKIKEESEK